MSLFGQRVRSVRALLCALALLLGAVGAAIAFLPDGPDKRPAGPALPSPRLDDVMVRDFKIIESDWTVSTTLIAFGANIDSRAQVHIDGKTQKTKPMANVPHPDMNPNLAATLGYPIYFYGAVSIQLEGVFAGTTVEVVVENPGGKLSNPIRYRLAANMEELDSDGDGIPDVWEEQGYRATPDGPVLVNLPKLGADKYHKDLFIEVDWMKEAAPNPAVWPAAKETFATAPVFNPDGTLGIALHIDYGQPGAGGGGGTIIPYAELMYYEDKKAVPKTTANFHRIKADKKFFDPNRLLIYRYCIFCWDNGYTSGSSGQAEDIWCNDFFVSLGRWGAEGKRADVQTGTFLHELGHTLGLRHGGFEDANNKDNYNSIMQYGKRKKLLPDGTTSYLSPSQFGGIDLDYRLNAASGVFTYSEGVRADLDETDLDENKGVGNHQPFDWNANGKIERNVRFRLDDSNHYRVIKDHADWANIKLDFRGPCSNWDND
jgi:hypothetical protein